jgi:hypothetical protein
MERAVDTLGCAPVTATPQRGGVAGDGSDTDPEQQQSDGLLE